jgi:hypothetical protein
MCNVHTYTCMRICIWMHVCVFVCVCVYVCVFILLVLILEVSLVSLVLEQMLNGIKISRCPVCCSSNLPSSKTKITSQWCSLNILKFLPECSTCLTSVHHSSTQTTVAAQFVCCAAIVVQFIIMLPSPPNRLCPACQWPLCMRFHQHTGNWHFCVLQYSDRLEAQVHQWQRAVGFCWRTVPQNLM